MMIEWTVKMLNGAESILTMVSHQFVSSAGQDFRRAAYKIDGKRVSLAKFNEAKAQACSCLLNADVG